MPAPKKEDYRVTRGKTLEAEKKRAAANPNKKVVLPSKENMKNVAALAATIGLNAIPTIRAAKVVSSFVSASKATNLASGASKTKTKIFTQGNAARVTNTTSKASGSAKYSPTKGTKVKVEYKTKELSPKQQATLTVGRTARESTKKVGTFVKGVGTGAYLESQRINARKKSK